MEQLFYVSPPFPGKISKSQCAVYSVTTSFASRPKLLVRTTIQESATRYSETKQEIIPSPSMNVPNHNTNTKHTTTSVNITAASTRRFSTKHLFPAKLHRLLEENQHERIISWQPHGQCFLVHDRDEFVKNVMPKYFDQSKMPSFLRQLNVYGFKRLEQKGLDKGGYYHRLFVRGNSQDYTQMSRVVGRTASHSTKTSIVLSKRNIQSAATRSPPQEPNFYSLQLPALVVAGIVAYPKEEEFSQTRSLQQNAWSRPALPRFTSSHPSAMARKNSVSHNWKSWYHNLEPVDISVQAL
eukprot:scaffold1965_cov214-Chaetoceros_neogracile.AAC.5